ncbi:MAG TPA: hypothetical protein VMV13_09375 [Candidatus Binataceae bacterium]|nr:hypothetical protein [Candidatus Binataceae bacterium]
MNVPVLEDRIIAHGKLMLAASADADAYLADSARESYREATGTIAPMRPFDNFETLALAKIGGQFISKLRLTGRKGIAKLLIRWKQTEDGAWVIAGAEDISTKPSPWSDIQHYTAEREGNSNG